MNERRVIHHTSGTSFQVRTPNGPDGPVVDLPDPAIFPVQGGDGKPLLEALRWYYEDDVRTPIAELRPVAHAVMNALSTWGRTSFALLFPEGAERSWLSEPGSGAGTLSVESDDPGIHAWPWEALEAPECAGPLSLSVQIVRGFLRPRTPKPVPRGLPDDRLRVLFVTARPLKGDVSCRAVSGPLIQAIADKQLPIEIIVVRPPTWAATRLALKARPSHVLHFDGHGEAKDGGVLLFEDDQHNADRLPAVKIAAALQENPVPVVVLTACNSGRLSQPHDRHASVATALLQGGVQQVVAMAQVLHADAAAQLVPAFYERMSRDPNPATSEGANTVAEAVRHARNVLYQEAKRQVWGGTITLEDATVPVLYENQPKVWGTPKPDRRRRSGLGPLLRERDRELLDLDRTLGSGAPVMLLTGPELIGKSTLLRELYAWRSRTGGPRVSLVNLANRAGATLLHELVLDEGQALLRAEERDKLAALRDSNTIFFLDDADASDDPGVLARLAETFRGGPPRIVLTAQQVPAWLPADLLRHVPLQPLSPAQIDVLLATLTARHGLRHALNTPEAGELIAALGGLPGLFTGLLPLLQHHAADKLLSVWRAESASGVSRAALERAARRLDA